MSRIEQVANNPVEVLARMLSVSGIEECAADALMSPGFQIERQQLMAGTFRQRDAIRLLRNLRQVVHTQTQYRLISDTPYLFDGPIPGAQGQVGTTLEYVTRDGRILCAKIGAERTIRQEFDVASIVHTRFRHCPTLLRVEDFIKIREDSREGVDHYALITQFYPRSLACFVDAAALRQPQLNQFLANVLTCGLASVKALSACGKCHGDIKYVIRILTGVGAKSNDYY